MEHGCHFSLLCNLLSLLLLVQLPMWSYADKFQVNSPTDPIVAVLGGDATLPCFLSPAMNAEDMELWWFRSTFSEPVLIYQNGQEMNEEQMPQYTGRTSLVRDFLHQGAAAVHIKNIQVSDNGKYTCFFKQGRQSEEAVLDLVVAGLGSDPQVHIEGPEKDGVRVACKASGWFPKPQVQWRDFHGNKFLEFSETHTQDAAGLFSVEAALVVRESSNGDMTCAILNPILGQEKVMAIPIPVPFFPQASHWKAAFAVSLTVLGLLLVGAGWVTKREHSAKVRERQRQKDLCHAKEEEHQAKEEELKITDELQAELDRRKSAFQAVWRKAQLYADWRKEEFEACFVTLDPGSALGSLAVSHERTSVAWKDSFLEEKNVDLDDYCSVLACDGIELGRCYWEVEIRGGLDLDCALGVCREHVTRTGFYDESPEEGFWVVEWFYGLCFVCTGNNNFLPLRHHPHRVGIFLNYSEGEVSFYNMTDGSHIFSFPPTSFSGPLFPYFRLTSGDVTLSICTPVGGSEGLPVALSGSSLENTGRSQVEGLSSCSGADNVLPRAESPLLS